MKRTYLLFFLVEFLTLGNSTAVVVSEIKLAGPKNQVLSSEQRSIVLEAADKYLNRTDEAFITSLQSLQNPYIKKSDIVVSGVAKVEKNVLVHSTASILELIGANFARQVRGTIAKGSTYYLQLQGGSLMEAGSSFPVEIPQIKDQSFVVTILDVSSRGYTLKMEDALLEVLFEVSSGVTKD